MIGMLGGQVPDRVLGAARRLLARSAAGVLREAALARSARSGTSSSLATTLGRPHHDGVRCPNAAKRPQRPAVTTREFRGSSPAEFDVAAVKPSPTMRHCLEIVDETGRPAYLETPNPRTVPFYERAGFSVTGVAQARRCPPITLTQRACR
jgi:hypothetical protein